MRWIVDGMNVIGSNPDGWWNDRAGARRRLVARLAGLVGRPGMTKIEVVFDGHPTPEEEEMAPGPVVVSYAGRGADAADKVIAEAVERSGSPQDLSVVTSDAALAAVARAKGARVVSTSAFRRLLQ